MKQAGIYKKGLRLARKKLFLLFLLSAPQTLCSQPSFSFYNFSAVDSFVIKIKYQNDYTRLARDLTAKFPDDVYKVRAIFKWISNNITYDYRFVNSGKELIVPECSDQFDCIEIMRNWENNYVKKILRNGKATAEGYAKLFRKLCEIVHIRTEVLTGYLRTKPYQIGNRMSVNHYWNAVLIDTTWFFADVCLASGHCNEDEETGKLLRFVKDYQNYYWFVPFEKLARTHFPGNLYWGDLYHVTLQQFLNKPHFYSTDMLENIVDECPDTGIITIRKNDTIHFSFTYRKAIRYIQVNSNNYRNPSLWTTVALSKRRTKVVRDSWAEKKQVYLPFIKYGRQYSFDYIVKDISTYYVEVAFDYKKAMRYKVNVVR